jgi:hypothetical protein
MELLLAVQTVRLGVELYERNLFKNWRVYLIQSSIGNLCCVQFFAISCHRSKTCPQDFVLNQDFKMIIYKALRSAGQTHW